MNRADAMLKVLRSSDSWWPRQIIFSRADRFFLTNNAAAELRARGYDVEHRVIKGQHHYRLLSDRHVTPSAVPIAEQTSAAGRRPPRLGGSSSEAKVDRVDEGPQPPSTPAAVQTALDFADFYVRNYGEPRAA